MSGAYTAALSLDLQPVYRMRAVPVSAARIERYVRAALHTVGLRHATDITIRMVDEPESQDLNREYRGKDKPTNVLSFPADFPAEMITLMGQQPLGDLVICLPIVSAEAHAQGKRTEHHLAHLVVHGTLHLLGYDHEPSPADDAHMEGLEIGTLARLGFSNPYVV
ncbi:MAG: hypothetical protein RL180_21 [Pseudomonadota bacterium]